MTSSSSPIIPLDLSETLAENRLVGLWRLLRGYYPHFIAANLAVAVSALSRTATYLLIGYFVDEVLGAGKSWQYMALVALGFVGLALVQGGFTFLSGWLATKTAEGVALRLRNYVYDHIQRLSFSFHDQTRTGELIQRSTSDVEAVRRFYQEQAMSIGRILLLFIINFVAIWRIDARLALISVVAVPALVLISYFFFKRIAAQYKRYQEQDAVVSSTLQENLSGVRVVKAFARQGYEKEKFDNVSWLKYKFGRKLILFHSLFWPGSDLIAGFQMLTGYVVGGVMVMNGVISIGSYLAYIGMLVYIIWPMRNLGRVIVQTSTALVSYERVAAIIREEKEPLEDGDQRPTGPVAGDIRFEDVSFSYEGESSAPILKRISFHCQPGQTVALLGASGSGKTTLVNLLPRFYDYTEGRILLDGVALRRYPRRYLRSQMAFVEQEPFLFSRTLRANIAYGVDREVSEEEIIEAARAAAIHESIINFPQGYDTLVGERGVTLSGGQKQRIAIARAILRDPRILILDDATSSVDAETEELIQQALQRLMAGRTTFVIAHRFQTVMNADLIIVLEKGEIVQMGDHETLIRQPGFYHDIYQLQSKLDEALEESLA
jgi:ATP-binding cassette subfamily B protein